jgi:hypothetical protein
MRPRPEQVEVEAASVRQAVAAWNRAPESAIDCAGNICPGLAVP